MKQIILLVTFALANILANAQAWIKTDGATVFRFITKNEKGKKIGPNMILLADLYGTAKKASNKEQDTVIFNSGSADKPFYIPTEQPGLQTVFYQMNEGDSVEIKILADTFYAKTFSAQLPDFVASGSVITLYFHVQEALTKTEIEQKAKQQNKASIKADSLLVIKYCNKQKGFKKSKTGLWYKKLVQNPTGIPTHNGAMVSVKYKGWLIDGDVFDENISSTDPFKFVVGMNQVIPGWEEGLRLMKTGEKIRLVIPWYLAYGTHGTGPIPPFTSIVFDVQLIDIK